MRTCRYGHGLTVSVALAAWSFAQPASVLLKPKVTEGHRVYLELADSIAQKITGPGPLQGGISVNSTQTYGVWRTVESTTDNKLRLACTYDRIAMRIDAGGAAEYDSDRRGASEESQFTNIFDPMIGETVRLETGPDGTATVITGFDELLKKVDRSAGGDPYWAGLRQSLSPETFRTQVWDKPRAIYPNKDVKPGDSWKAGLVSRLPRMGDVVYSYDCKLQGITKSGGRDVATIEYTGDVKMADESRPIQIPGGGAMKLEKGTLRGTAIFDIERGEITTQTTEAELSFASATPASAPEGQKPTPTTLTQKSTSVVRILTPDEREKQKRENAAKARESRSDREAAESRPAEP